MEDERHGGAQSLRKTALRCSELYFLAGLRAYKWREPEPSPSHAQ